MLEDHKQQVCQANLDPVAHGLVTLTWGNVSGLSRDRQLLVVLFLNSDGVGQLKLSEMVEDFAADARLRDLIE